MRLAAFIRADTKEILAEWESFARGFIPAAHSMSSLALRDHIEEILAFVADDIESFQTDNEQIEKSHGEKPADARDRAAETHASLRQAGGFNLSQMLSEYRALRASVIRLWSVVQPKPTGLDIADLTRFNEAIDQALTASVNYYSETLDDSRTLLLGILSHDLRNPLSAAQMSAELTLEKGPLTERQMKWISQCIESTGRATGIIARLLDVANARLGSGLPIFKEQMNMGIVSKILMNEMRTLHPSRTFALELFGDMRGEWDKPRIGQVFSNLLGNAEQYSFAASPITTKVRGRAKEVTISVHNEGVPIATESLGSIFEPFTRGSIMGVKNSLKSKNVGLGLFIVKEIVSAHGGAINVCSSEGKGTTFTARFPRSYAPEVRLRRIGF